MWYAAFCPGSSAGLAFVVTIHMLAFVVTIHIHAFVLTMHIHTCMRAEVILAQQAIVPPGGGTGMQSHASNGTPSNATPSAEKGLSAPSDTRSGVMHVSSKKHQPPVFEAGKTFCSRHIL